MHQEFYYKPKEHPKSLIYVLWTIWGFGGLLFLFLLFVFIKNLSTPNQNNLALIKDLVSLIVPLIIIYKLLIRSKPPNTKNPIPMFIFDENGMIFNHPEQGFELGWQDIQSVDMSFMYNIPTLVIYTKTNKHKIEMQYFENDENVNIQKVFNEYAMKYSGKKLIL